MSEPAKTGIFSASSPEPGPESSPGPSPGPGFDAAFQARLHDLFLWRRDVRHFQTRPLEPGLVESLIREAGLAPSVGYSQPWRFVRVSKEERRAAVRADFSQCNARALEDYEGEQARLYASLKLSGLEAAPVQLAVFVDEGSKTGKGLGRKTMPETMAYSVVMAVHTLWLAGRARGLGLGWVSILNPDKIRDILEVPEDWSLVAYLCLGYPVEEHCEPELSRFGWEERSDESLTITER